MLYRQNLNKARQDTSREFFAVHDNYSELVEIVCEITFQCVLEIESKFKLTKYQHGLLASFARTTVISAELVVTSELIGAVTLLRKQIELIARLYELEHKSLEDLTGRTPNVKGLRSRLKRLYSPFLEGAHSATYGSMALLGFYENHERREHIMYPEFTENTEVIFQNWIFVFFEFSLWFMMFKGNRVADYDESEDEGKFQKVMTLYKQSGLKHKFKGKHGN